MKMQSALKLAILESGLKQYDIADKAGIHESRLSKIVRGRLRPTRVEKEALAKALRRNPQAIFPCEAIAS